MPPHAVTVRRTIAATPQQLWAVLTTVDHWPVLFRSVVEMDLIGGGGEYAPGTRWRETRSMFGRSTTQVVQVVEASPPSQIVAIVQHGETSHRLTHTLEVSGDHTDSRPRTLVRTRLESDQPQGLWRVLGTLGARATQETLAQDLADLAAAVERPETQDMVVVHRLFTRELSAGPNLVRAVPVGDIHRAGVVCDHLTIVLDTLVDHHHGEDVLIWPLLSDRTPIDPELSERLRVQHAQIHAQIVDVHELIARWRVSADSNIRERLAVALGEFSAVLRTHLEAEENTILPLIEQHLTRVEYDRLAAHGRASLPKDRAAVIVGLFLEGTTAAEQALVLKDYPLATQWLIRTVGARQYQRYVRRLRVD